MPLYRGGCHCGAVRFEAARAAPIDRLIECDCSICVKKGILHCPVEEDGFALVAGAGALSLYRFGTGTAEHRFCRHCGIHVYGRPRSHPERLSVNARCLDDFDAVRAGATVVPFDGRNHPKDREGA